MTWFDRIVVYGMAVATIAALIAFTFASRDSHAAITSWYGPGFEGRLMANGEPFSPAEPICAHRSLPFGTVLKLRYRGRVAYCVVRDRGPYVAGRTLDVSRAVASRLGMIRAGVVQVHVERVS